MARLLKSGLPPISDANARIFILGSLPGEASLAAERYYAHPQNQFWRLLEAATGEQFVNMDYALRLDRLKARGIGLWDVIAAAERPGSLDGAMRNIAPNSLEQLRSGHPRLEVIAFNGQKASSLGRKLLGNEHGLTLIDLPSSSAANTQPIGDKLKVWSGLAAYCTCPAS